MADEQLIAVSDLPDTVEISGEQYKIYPLTLGKIAYLGNVLESVSGIASAFDSMRGDDGKSLKDAGILPALMESIDNIAYAFMAVTSPNSKKGLPKFSKEQADEIKNIMTIDGLAKTIGILIQQSNFSALLKNVLSLKGTLPNSLGADSSPLPSESPSGKPTI